jgi:hypothetical protein
MILVWKLSLLWMSCFVTVVPGDPFDWELGKYLNGCLFYHWNLQLNRNLFWIFTEYMYFVSLVCVIYISQNALAVPARF